MDSNTFNKLLAYAASHTPGLPGVPSSMISSGAKALSEDVPNYTRAVLGQGALMGWGDELEASLKAKAKGTNYKDELNNIRSSYGSFQRAHPLTSAAAEFGGGMIPAALASYVMPASAAPVIGRGTGVVKKTLTSPLVQDILKSVPVGAAYGAVSGAGNANDEGERGKSAVTGGVVGGVIGGAVPAVIHGGSSLYNWALNRLGTTGIDDLAAKYLGKTLAKSGTTPQQAGELVSRDVVSGVPSTLANVNKDTANLAAAVVKHGGPGGANIEQKIEAQALGSKGRVIGATKKALGVDKTFSQSAEDLSNELKANAGPKYDAAYEAHPEIDDPRIESMLNQPIFRQAYATGKKISQYEATAAEMRGEDPAKFQLTPLFKEDEPGVFTTSRDLTPEDFITDEKGNVRLADRSTSVLPNLRTLDYTKRGLDDIIDAKFRSGSVGSAEARALADMRKSFIGILDEVAPEYADARKYYSSQREVQEALDHGKQNFGRMSADQLQNEYSSMTPAEQSAFKTGAMDDVYKKIMTSDSQINAASKIIGSPDYAEKLKVLFNGSDAQYDLFKSTMLREAQLHQQASRILAQSESINGKKALTEEGSQSVNPFIDLITKRPLTLFRSFMSSLRSQSISDPMANRISELLMSSNPDEVATAVRMLDRASGQLKEQAAGVTKTGLLGTAGATAAAQTPQYMDPGSQEAAPQEQIPLSEIPAQPPLPTGLGDSSGVDDYLNREISKDIPVEDQSE